MASATHHNLQTLAALSIKKRPECSTHFRGMYGSHCFLRSRILKSLVTALSLPMCMIPQRTFSTRWHRRVAFPERPHSV